MGYPQYKMYMPAFYVYMVINIKGSDEKMLILCNIQTKSV